MSDIAVFLSQIAFLFVVLLVLRITLLTLSHILVLLVPTYFLEKSCCFLNDPFLIFFPYLFMRHIFSPSVFNNASALLTVRCALHFCATFSSAHLCHPPEAFISVGNCTPTEIKMAGSIRSPPLLVTKNILYVPFLHKLSRSTFPRILTFHVSTLIL